MRRADDLGTVEPGKLADLLVIDGDPAADITALSRREPLVSLIGSLYQGVSRISWAFSHQV